MNENAMIIYMGVAGKSIDSLELLESQYHPWNAL